MKKFKSITTEENMEYYIFLNDASKFCVCLRDLDAEKNVSITICLNEAQAEEVLAKFVNASVGSIPL